MTSHRDPGIKYFSIACMLSLYLSALPSSRQRGVNDGVINLLNPLLSPLLILAYWVWSDPGPTADEADIKMSTPLGMNVELYDPRILGLIRSRADSR